MIGKKAGIVLIVGNKGDKSIARIQKTIDVHGLDIRLWIMKKDVYVPITPQSQN